MFNNYHKFYLSLVLLWAAIKSSCRDDLQIARNPDGVLSPHPHLAHFLFFLNFTFSFLDSSSPPDIFTNQTNPDGTPLHSSPSILTPRCQSLYSTLLQIKSLFSPSLHLHCGIYQLQNPVRALHLLLINRATHSNPPLIFTHTLSPLCQATATPKDCQHCR